MEERIGYECVVELLNGSKYFGTLSSVKKDWITIIELKGTHQTFSTKNVLRIETKFMGPEQ